jgi:hypothetical protein
VGADGEGVRCVGNGVYAVQTENRDGELDRDSVEIPRILAGQGAMNRQHDTRMGGGEHGNSVIRKISHGPCARRIGAATSPLLRHSR